MNRRQKIIVSVVGIFLVLLILVGLTYAYFLTKIQGNTKSTSITVKTANLALVYGDGNGELTSASLLEPGKSFKFKNSNGEEYESKTFTVKNEGDTTTDYVVVIKDVVITDLATDSTSSFQSNDFRYTLTCTTDGTIACSGVENEVFPMNGGIVVGNEIEEGKTHTYTLTMEYLETGEDQSDDMNKSLSAKIDIADIKEINPYSDKTTSLAYNIINNAKLNKNGTELRAVPDTTPAVATSSETEKVLSMTQDDYGKSYYYRGNVGDNYVTFANMCWRIVRIEGDGSIKLVLEDQDEECSKTMNGNWDIAAVPYGYIEINDNVYKINYLNYAGGMAENLKNFQDSKLDSLKTKLKSGDWCYDDTAYQDETGTTLITDTSSYYTNGTKFYYGPYIRLVNKKEPSLKCSGTNMTKFSDETDMYVGALTADEVVLAGGTTETSNQNYYLINDYQKNNYKHWWTLSPSHNAGTSSSGDSAFFLFNDVVRNFFSVRITYNVRPSINLKANTIITNGVGTKENPYIVE